MNQMKPIFQFLPFNCTKGAPENHNQFCDFCHGGETHFLVLAQTLMKEVVLPTLHGLVVMNQDGIGCYIYVCKVIITFPSHTSLCEFFNDDKTFIKIARLQEPQRLTLG